MIWESSLIQGQEELIRQEFEAVERRHKERDDRARLIENDEERCVRQKMNERTDSDSVSVSCCVVGIVAILFR